MSSHAEGNTKQHFIMTLLARFQGALVFPDWTLCTTDTSSTHAALHTTRNVALPTNAHSVHSSSLIWHTSAAPRTNNMNDALKCRSAQNCPQGALIFPDLDVLEGLLAERQQQTASSSSSSSSSSGGGGSSSHPLVSKASHQELEQLYMAEIARLVEAG